MFGNEIIKRIDEVNISLFSLHGQMSQKKPMKFKKVISFALVFNNLFHLVK
jgi:hypothetical protein